MTQEDKELLLKDLCARLPYRTMVKCNTDYHHEFDEELSVTHIMNFYQFEIKPYLRPMSSMTEEERKELQEIAVALSYNKDDILIGTQINSFRQLDGVLDLFNSHHLDWRGLIEKGLALEALEDMYNLKKK